jgi:GT2 family glycosyltransferase
VTLATDTVEPPSLLAVRRAMVDRGHASLQLLPANLLVASGEPRVTAIVVTRNRPVRVNSALLSLRTFPRLPLRLLVIDNDSEPGTREAVRQACRAHGAELIQLERNMGSAGGRQLGVERAASEYVLFLDDDAEVFPGAVEHLVHGLDATPGSVACCANVVLPDGRVQLCGGDYRDSGVLRALVPIGRGLAFDDPALGPSGPCHWICSALILVRRAALTACPLAADLAYFVDNDWSHRVQQLWPGSLHRSVSALALHHQEEKGRRDSSLVGIGEVMPYIGALARLYQLYGRILDTLFAFVPELVGPGGELDTAAAQLLLELIAARGTEWALHNWLNGGLAPLFCSGRETAVRLQLEAARAEAETGQAELIASRRELERLRAELEASREQIAIERCQLAVIGQEAAETGRQLATIHASRLWQAANWYWSFRRRARAIRTGAEMGSKL